MSEKNKEGEENKPKKHPKIAGVNYAELKAAVKDILKDSKQDRSNREIRKEVEQELELQDGELKRDDFEEIIETVKKDLKEAKEKKKKREEESKEKLGQKKSSDKRRRENSSDRPSKKSKRRTSSESESRDRKRKTTTKPKHSTKKKSSKNMDDPKIKKIERLKKVLRGCGVPLIGFHTDLTEDQVLEKLQHLIDVHSKEGLKEKMSREKMVRVRATIQANREVEELKCIPKKLQMDTKGNSRPTRKSARQRVLFFPLF